MQDKTIEKRNNKGITLIELIVSIAILAIVVLPLLTAFIVSLKTNAKAKEKLRAVEIAHNFMEGMEAASVKDIMTQLNYPQDKFDLLVNLKDVSVWNTAVSGSGINAASSVELVDNGTDDYTASILAEDLPAEYDLARKEKSVTSSIMKYGTGDYKFLGNPASKYYFMVRGIPSSDNVNKKFDAFITMDGTTPQEVSGTKKQEYNKEPVASIESMDADCDAVNIENVITVSNVIADINTETSLGLEESDQEHLQRLITLNIERPDPKVNRVKVTLSYSYHCEEFDKTVIVGDEVHTKVIPAFDFPKKNDSTFEEQYTKVIYDNLTEADGSEKYLKNIYLFYQPWYTSQLKGAEKDIIRVNNPGNYDCTVKLIKQQSVNDDELGLAEQNYHMRVELKEAVKSKPAHVKFETNLGTNISNDESFLDIATANQATYVYNNSIIPAGVGGKIYNAANLSISCKKEDAQIYVATAFGYSDILPKGEKYHDRLYDLRVDVYPRGVETKDIYAKSVKPIVSLTGGVTD